MKAQILDAASNGWRGVNKYSTYMQSDNDYSTTFPDIRYNCSYEQSFKSYFP